MSLRSRSTRLWLLLSLSSCVAQDPLTAQSTPSEQSPLSVSRSTVSSLSKASQELVLRLTERRQEVTRLSQKLAALESELAEALATHESTLMALRQELQETSNLLAVSKRDLQDLEQAADERARLDGDAVTAARRERDEARLWTWAAIVVAVGGVVWGVMK